MEAEPSPEPLEQRSQVDKPEPARDKLFLSSWLDKLRNRKLLVPEVALVMDNNSDMQLQTDTLSGDNSPESLPSLPTHPPEAASVLEQVAKAAEKDLPIEKEYELRHELKDAPPQVQGAEQIGAILSQKKSAARSASAFAQPTHAFKTGTSQSSLGHSLSAALNIYAHPLRFGLTAALIAIATFITIRLII